MTATTPSSEPTTWHADDSLNAFESLMWRLDKYDNLRSAVCGIEVIEGTLSNDEIRKVCNYLLRRAPRLSQRLVKALPFTNPVWQTDTHFSLDNHLILVDGGNCGLDEVFDMAADFAMDDFNRAHSPWELMYVSNLENDQSALILKIHHAMSDGIGIAQLLDILHSDIPEQVDDFGSQDGQPKTPALTVLRRSLLSREALKTRAQRSGALLGKLSRHKGAASELARYVSSLSRVLSPPDAKPSPLLSHRNDRWQFDGFTLPLDAMKGAAKSRSVKLNDIFIAGVLRGFWLYHQHAGVEHPAVPVTIPVNVRPEGKQGGGNHFVPLQISGPLCGDTTQLISVVNRQVQRKRREVALTAPMFLMPVLNSLPDSLVARQMSQQLRATDIQMSNVPGTQNRPSLAGRPVTALYPFAPLPGCAAMISLVSIAADCYVGLNLDSAAVTDKALLKQMIQQSFNDIFNEG